LRSAIDCLLETQSFMQATVLPSYVLWFLQGDLFQNTLTSEGLTPTLRSVIDGLL